MASEATDVRPGRDFIHDIIDAEIAAGRNTEVVLRPAAISASMMS